MGDNSSTASQQSVSTVGTLRTMLDDPEIAKRFQQFLDKQTGRQESDLKIALEQAKAGGAEPFLLFKKKRGGRNQVGLIQADNYSFRQEQNLYNKMPPSLLKASPADLKAMAVERQLDKVPQSAGYMLESEDPVMRKFHHRLPVDKDELDERNFTFKGLQNLTLV